MDYSALYPPNHRVLSDSVIGNVRERVRPPSYEAASDLLSFQQKSQCQVTVTLRHQRRPPATKQVTPVDNVSTSAMDEIERRRQRNRMHQARHKLKQRQKVDGLEVDVARLKTEIEELRMQREVLSAGVMTNTTVWNAAAEYFRVFRYGVKASEVGTFPFQVQTQRRFLQATMVESVVSDHGFGVEALIENWSFVTTYHPDIDIQLMCLENNAEGLIVGTTLGRLTITENTLRHAFPNLVEEEEGERAQLARQLLGQQLVMRGAIQFEWDNSLARIARVQHKADLLTPLLELLGSLEAVSRVFDNARVTPQSTVVTS